MSILCFDLVGAEKSEDLDLVSGSRVTVCHPLLSIPGELVCQSGPSQWLVRLPQAGPGVLLRVGENSLRPPHQ